jgi:class 3 adenylate cyclase/tetratricopeptide (TPR) repeat protein
MICTKCGSDAPSGARFCPSCGASLEAAPVPEERKLVSVFFVDLVGSTARADGADPEDVRDLNQLYYREARERIERHGGVVEKYVGDAVMAVFGAPLARSDDAERAVSAALSVVEGIVELNAAHPGLDLRVRAAVCTGDAMVAVGAAPSDALATGDVVNVAARLQAAAPHDGVVVDAETHRLTRHAFAFEELPAVEAKGKREPVPAWLVGRALTPLGRPTSGTPFVGRDRELLLIQTLWERVCAAATPHLITVLGPAGIGKTRLGREATAAVEAQGGRVLWGRSLPYEEQTPYRSFAQIVRRAASIYENDTAEAARTKLADLIEAVFPAAEAAESRAHLGQLLGLVRSEGTDDQFHLYYAARRFVELLAARDPLLLVFEDLHWADDALMDLLEYLVSHVADQPVGFLALARPEFVEARPAFGAGLMGQTKLPLEPLTPPEATEVVASLLAAAPDTLRTLVERAEGNPLFLEELAAAVSDDPDVSELPTTVRAAIAARIDALPTEARSGLLHASVVGQSFWRGVVQRVGEFERVDEALEALEARGLIQRRPESQVAGDVEYAFRHVLIRDVAYATLPRALRRDLHAATARVIEASVPDPQELAWVLALHWREGGDAAKAIEYLIAAGDRSLASLAGEQTYDLYSRALELATTDEDRRHILLRRGLALVQLEDFARADEELANLIPDLGGADEVEAIVARARATFWTEQAEETLALAERGADLARERVPALEPVALARLSGAHSMRGEAGDLDRAIELGDRALEMWVSQARQPELAEHFHMHADNFYWRGDYARTLVMSESAAEVGGLDPSSAEFLLRGAGMRGLALAGMGRYEEALETGGSVIATARRIGRPDNVVMNYSTLALRDIFWLDEAAERSATVRDRLGPSDFNMPWMNARADLISSHLLRGDIGAVEREWDGAWEDAAKSHAWERWLVGGRLAAVRAESALEARRIDEALEWGARALELARTGGRGKYAIEASLTLGRALAAQGEHDRAFDRLREAVALAEGHGGSPLLRWRTRAALGEVALERSETGIQGEACLQEAATIIGTIADSLAEERAARYREAPQVRAVLDRVG